EVAGDDLAAYLNGMRIGDRHTVLKPRVDAELRGGDRFGICLPGDFLAALTVLQVRGGSSSSRAPRARTTRRLFRGSRLGAPANPGSLCGPQERRRWIAAPPAAPPRMRSP